LLRTTTRSAPTSWDASEDRKLEDGSKETTTGWCCDSLLYKGSEDDKGLELEVTGWAWNKRTSTKVRMMTIRDRVRSSMVAIRLRLWG
jgi:hypothetical protein